MVDREIQEARKIWTNALRSGEYVQGKEALHVKTESEEQHCCLGVACVKFNELNPDSPLHVRGPVNKDEHFMYDGEVAYLPVRVAEWLGMPNHGSQILGDLNDSGLSFEKIADVIEADAIEDVDYD